MSSEGELPEELQQYKFPLSPSKMHDAMAFSSMIFGESATMVTEGVMMGVPGVYLDNTGRYYTRDLEEKYGLCFNYTESKEDQLKAIAKGVEILQGELPIADGYKKMMSEKIDVTEWLCGFVENYWR